jgi:hypothetical protein
MKGEKLEARSWKLGGDSEFRKDEGLRLGRAKGRFAWSKVERLVPKTLSRLLRRDFAGGTVSGGPRP